MRQHSVRSIVAPGLLAEAAMTGARGGPPAVDWRGWVGFMSMVLGMFMAILDIQIVSSSISEIQAGLAASVDEVAWVQTSYLIAEIVMIPLSGWLSRLLSTRILFVASAVGFTIFSALCASASSLPAMIFYRAMQGFIGGAMIPTVFATSFLMFGAGQQVKVSVVIGLVATLAPTIGPTLGGWLTDSFSWHWLFLINVPVGALVAVSVWTFLDIDRPDFALLRRFDYIGLLLLAAFLGSLEYVMEDGNKNDWFGDATITRFAILSAVSGVLFFWRMLIRHDPLVDLRAFANANFAAGSLFSFVIGTGLYGSVFVVPMFLAQVRGFDALAIGENMFITGLFMFLSAPIAAQIARVLDLRRMLTLGLLMFGISLVWLARLTSQSDFWDMAWPQALRGFSMMFVMLPINQIALGTLPPEKLKNASGLFNLMRNLGGAVGLAMINTIATTRTAVHTLHLQEQVTWARPGAVQMLAMMEQGLRAAKGADAHLAALRELALIVQREALTLAYNDVLLVMSLAFFITLPLTFFLAKPKLAAGVAAGH
jgi:DHA2 family multidrug resistance protein